MIVTATAGIMIFLKTLHLGSTHYILFLLILSVGACWLFSHSEGFPT